MAIDLSGFDNIVDEPKELDLSGFDATDSVQPEAIDLSGFDEEEGPGAADYAAAFAADIAISEAGRLGGAAAGTAFLPGIGTAVGVGLNILTVVEIANLIKELGE